MDRLDLIASVQKPARYLGGEPGQVKKDPDQVRLWLALAFPEVYEIAMSHQGLKVLYHQLAGRPEVAAERVFMPWLDLMERLEFESRAPWSLESGRPLHRFDVIGFSLLYELTYSNMLHMLRLASIPLRREQRSAEHPLIIAGGPCTVNPEPVADFLDLAVVGEAEELIDELCDLFIRAKQEAWPRARLYQQAVRLEGVYAPALFQARYKNGRLIETRPTDPEWPQVRRRVVADLAAHAPPVQPLLPLVKPVHDRLGLEAARGCTRGCRFCQAGYIYRPVRERPAGDLLRAARRGLASSGLEELALLSLSTGDYSQIEPLVAALMDELEPRQVSLSLPSLRVESLSRGIIEQIRRVRKTGFTMAPEAGSQRLRNAINKGLGQEDILATARRVFSLGWRLVKLYFMVGLPGEEDEDLRAIGELCRAVLAQARAQGLGRGRRPLVNASLGVFVPKPHTPFQWEAMVDLDQARRRLRQAKASLGDRLIRAKWNSPEQSLLEGVFSRGDRRLARVLEEAVGLGCSFDGWSEQFDLAAWQEALARAGLSSDEYLRAREPDEVLPWDHIAVGVDKDFLWQERQRAYQALTTPDCRGGECLACGVCDFDRLRPRLATAGPLSAQPAPPAKRVENLKYRFRLSKTGPARFLGHQEMINLLVRSFRRAGLSLAYSHGHNPHPRLKLAGALPLGVESLCEEMEVTLAFGPEATEAAGRVNRLLPAGLELSHARRALSGERLEEGEHWLYRIESPAPLPAPKLAAFLAAKTWPLERRTPKGKRTIDLRPAIGDISIKGPSQLWVRVGTAQGRPRPWEILSAVFGLEPDQARAARATKLETC